MFCVIHELFLSVVLQAKIQSDKYFCERDRQLERANSLEKTLASVDQGESQQILSQLQDVSRKLEETELKLDLVQVHDVSTQPDFHFSMS